MSAKANKQKEIGGNEVAENTDAKKPKRRGRPPGSKNKKKSVEKMKAGPKKTAGTSIEDTIRLLLDLPTTTEKRLMLIKAVIADSK